MSEKQPADADRAHAPLIITSEQIRPATCVRLAEHLEDAIAKFVRWQMPQATRGRLPMCATLLRRVSTRGTYGSRNTDLQRVANAMSTAKDFADIAGALAD